MKGVDGWLGLDDGLHSNDQARREHCEALRSLQSDQRDWTEFLFWYENLSILDGKSASLLQFNSVVLAVIAIFYTSDRNSLLRFVFAGALLVSVVSCLLCLKVVWIHWSDTPSLQSPVEHGRSLLRVRDLRTRLYRAAWWLAGAGLLALLTGVGFSVVG